VSIHRHCLVLWELVIDSRHAMHQQPVANHSKYEPRLTGTERQCLEVGLKYPARGYRKDENEENRLRSLVGVEA
jgi:hypothetical protein